MSGTWGLQIAGVTPVGYCRSTESFWYISRRWLWTLACCQIRVRLDTACNGSESREHRISFRARVTEGVGSSEIRNSVLVTPGPGLVISGKIPHEEGISVNAIPGFQRITFDSQIMAGRACIRGMRIPVSLILNLVANRMTVEEILQEYPDLEPADIEETLRYAAWLSQERLLRPEGW